MAEPERFRDYGHGLVAFSDVIYVVCPACTGRATVIERPDLPARRYESDLFFRARRLTCPMCAASREWTAGRRRGGAAGAALGGPADPFFGLPLWLQVPCQGQVLWAYNQPHLDVLERYVSARLRERRRAACEMGMLARLPAWVKAARSREAVLRGIGHLRLQLGRSEPGTGPAST